MKIQTVGLYMRRAGGVMMVLFGLGLALGAFASRNHDAVSHEMFIPLMAFGLASAAFGVFAVLMPRMDQ